MRWSVIFSLLIVLVFAGCAQPARPTGSSAGSSAETPSANQKQLVIAVRGEPPSIAAKPVVAFSGSLDRPAELFNAMLDYRDENEAAHPMLAQELPQLNSDSWRVFPDGRMETTYKLKPNLTWQDGTPLAADDFVFAWRVYATPELGQATTPPIGQMEEVSAPDPITVLIRWKTLYPDAGVMDNTFQALPKHILESSFNQSDPIAFSSLPFWTSEYVGLGPYTVTTWEAGSYIEAAAFNGYALGRPKIDQIKVLFMTDPQTALANVLAGEVQLVADPLLSVAQAETLNHQWTQDHGGTLLYSPVGLRTTVFQMRPDTVESQALLDVRVRKAIAYGLDSQSAVDVLTDGKGIRTRTLTSPLVDYYSQIESAITKFDYDPRLAQRAMRDAGYAKGPDGLFVGSDGQTVQFTDASSAGDREEMELAVYVDSLRKAGFDASQRVVPVQQIRDPELRALLPGLQLRGGAYQLGSYTSDQIPRPGNRWVGDNRGGWSSAEYDRLFSAYTTTLEPSERVRQVAQMERLLTDQVPIVPNMYSAYAVAVLSGLKGPVARKTPLAGGPFLHVESWTWVT